MERGEEASQCSEAMAVLPAQVGLWRTLVPVCVPVDGVGGRLGHSRTNDSGQQFR